MTLALSIATFLDRWRSDCLGWTMRIDPVRAIYVRRSRRLLVSFTIAAAMSFLLSSFYPLWVLALGPVLWGLPHLVASFRYSSRELPTSKPSFFILVTLLSFFTAMMRLALVNNWGGINRTLGGLNQNLFIEFSAMSLLWLVAAVGLFKKRELRFSPGALGVLALFYCAWKAPLMTAGALILGHNFVGFFYWIRAAHGRSDRITAGLSLILFSAAHLAIFLGFADPLFQWGSSGGEIGLGLTVWEIGSQITSSLSMDYTWWFRATIAYAFGQSLHYFVWLRAIPEQQLPYETPTSFRQSLSYLQRDLGLRVANGALIGVVAASSLWILYEFTTARMIYLAIVSFHGFAEFVGLCFERRAA